MQLTTQHGQEQGSTDRLVRWPPGPSWSDIFHFFLVRYAISKFSLSWSSPDPKTWHFFDPGSIRSADRTRQLCPRTDWFWFVDPWIGDWEPESNWDSYYYLSIGAAIIGVIWYAIFFRIIKSCGERPKSDWRFKTKNPEFSIYDDEKEFSIAMK